MPRYYKSYVIFNNNRTYGFHLNSGECQNVLREWAHTVQVICLTELELVCLDQFSNLPQVVAERKSVYYYGDMAKFVAGNINLIVGTDETPEEKEIIKAIDLTLQDFKEKGMNF